MRKLLSGVAAAAILLSGCVQADNQAASNGTSAPTTAANDADPALWLVKDADTNVYLFGTFHALRPGQTWFDEGVRAAYQRSGEVVLEIVEPDTATMQGLVARYGVDADGPPLRQKLSAATRAKYEAAMRANGLPVEAFDQFHPWYAALTLSVVPLLKAGWDANSGAEKVISAQARTDGKTVGQLETAEQQLGMFAGLPEPQQIAYLEEVLNNEGSIVGELDRMAQLWAAGDHERLGAMMNEALRATPELGKILLANRNARWAQWIDDRMDRPGTVFVAVGAGHLAGADSVQRMLTARNLTATRVRY